MGKQNEAGDVKILGRCMKCKKQMEMKEMKKVTMKNGRSAAKGKCIVCGTNMFKILSKEER